MSERQSTRRGEHLNPEIRERALAEIHDFRVSSNNSQLTTADRLLHEVFDGVNDARTHFLELPTGSIPEQAYKNIQHLNKLLEASPYLRLLLAFRGERKKICFCPKFAFIRTTDEEFFIKAIVGDLATGNPEDYAKAEMWFDPDIRTAAPVHASLPILQDYLRDKRKIIEYMARMTPTELVNQIERQI